MSVGRRVYSVKMHVKNKSLVGKEGRNIKTTLLIMAAGIGSRFGGGIKQLEPVDQCGHIIMDYSVHDAIEAGFNKVVYQEDLFGDL